MRDGTLSGVIGRLSLGRGMLGKYRKGLPPNRVCAAHHMKIFDSQAGQISV